jgi:3-mercaptopyruvate sulfurtransferase SseA
MRILFSLIFAVALTVASAAQNEGRFQIDPQTGRAIGAKEMSPQELKSHIDRKTKMLIIDVREPEAFGKETIKGAINIPIGQLESRLKDIPKDTLLAFT